jgi:2,3-bisphosphoglycerate-dependent phosphoglycerate mutase
MNLVFVRHGQSIWNLKNKFTGWVDIGLSDQGIQEAITAGKTLIENNFIPEICFTSYLSRSIETSNKLLNEYDLNIVNGINIFKRWQLNERHYGALQGLDKIDTAKKYGEKQVHEWRRGYRTKPPLVEKDSKFDPKLDKAYEDIDTTLPLGESLEDVVARVESTLNEIIELSKNKNVLVVAHGNSIRAMLKIIENISDKSIVEVNIPTGIPLAFNINNDKITKIGYLGDKQVIEELEKEVKQQLKTEKDS